jgi:hypothetical protein
MELPLVTHCHSLPAKESTSYVVQSHRHVRIMYLSTSCKEQLLHYLAPFFSFFLPTKSRTEEARELSPSWIQSPVRTVSYSSWLRYMLEKEGGGTSICPGQWHSPPFLHMPHPQTKAHPFIIFQLELEHEAVCLYVFCVLSLAAQYNTIQYNTVQKARGSRYKNAMLSHFRWCLPKLRQPIVSR